MNNFQVAETIMQQLGGARFVMMTGSKFTTATKGGLNVKLAKNKSGANFMVVTLDANDTYTMGFYKMTAKNIDVVSIENGVYCDQLQTIFTDVTGLYTSL